MRIQRLDIQGFKSFAERVTLHFGQGVTGVVGPNGCGKSNIVDAIRWAMGEQSPRMLRGGSMQDVIFNGSETRGPMGMAEVTLSFDNDGKNVPPDYAHIAEIQVTRRLYRDGDSEYEINKTPCRLKDVHDLFLGTGVGTRAYSIIQQGQVSEIMRVKPEDRRRIIEEAAGITKYKARKEAALRKMDATRQNLTRIDDVTKELGRRLGSLKRQAKKAERYVELKGQVKNIDHHLVTLKFFELKNGAQYDRALLDDLIGAVTGDIARAAELELQVSTVREALSAEEKKLNEKQGRLYEIDAHLALHGQTADLSKGEYERSKKRDEEAAVEVEKLREQRAMLQGAREELARGRSALEEETAVDESSLQGAFADLDQHRQQRQTLGQEVEKARRSMIEHSTTAAKAASDVHNLRSSLTDMGARRDAVVHERAPLVDELTRLQEALALLDVERSTVETDKTVAEAERKLGGEQIQESKRELSKLERSAADAQDSWQKKRSRLTSLEEIHARYEQAPEAVRALLKRGGVLEGKAKLLADLFEADAATEAALEAAIGARLQSVIIDDEALALRASEALRDGRTKGRADILITAALQAPLTERLDGLRCAADLVQFGKQAESARSVLSRIFLSSSAEQALVVWPQARSLGATIVCDSGDVLSADGAMRAGVADKDGQGVLRQKREMRELVDAVATAEQAAQEAQALLQQQRDALTDLDEGLSRVTERAQALSLKAVEVRAGHKRVGDELQRLRERQQRLQQDEERLSAGLGKAEADAHRHRRFVATTIVGLGRTRRGDCHQAGEGHHHEGACRFSSGTARGFEQEPRGCDTPR
jgi:chromosome segregation protein